MSTEQRAGDASRDITVVDVRPGPIAVARIRTTLARWPSQFMKLSAAVYEAIETGHVLQQGENVMVYRPAHDDQVDIECGVQVAAKFKDIGGVVCRETPGGSAAKLVHTGPYDQLPASHRSIIEWARRNGRRLAGVSWEIYGDWEDDPAALRTEILHLLAPARSDA